MENNFQDQLDRIDRLMEIVNEKNPYQKLSGLLFYDIIVFACQSMWHMKDWIINDPQFGVKDIDALKREIHSYPCLLVCSDIANGTKHLVLEKSKTGSKISDRRGIHIDIKDDIFLENYFIHCSDKANKFHNLDIRFLLKQCRDTWENIINNHYLSGVDDL